MSWTSIHSLSLMSRDVSMHIRRRMLLSAKWLSSKYRIFNLMCVVAIWKLAMTMERMSNHNHCLLWSYQKLTISKKKQNFIDHSVPIHSFIIIIIFSFNETSTFSECYLCVHIFMCNIAFKKNNAPKNA